MSSGNRFKISCLKNLDRDCWAWRPDVVLSFLDPGTKIEDFLTYRPKHHQVFFFYDQENSADIIVLESEMKRFLRDTGFLVNDDQLRILFHCHAGVSRSTACTYISLCRIYRDQKHISPFVELLKIARKPWPNLKLCEIAEKLLETGGDIVGPVLEYRCANFQRLKVYRRLNRMRGLVSPVPR